MKQSTIIFISLLSLTLVGCRIAKSSTPLGLMPAHLSTEYIEGTWEEIGGGATVKVEVIDLENALLDVTMPNFRFDSDGKMKKIRIQLMAGNKWQYASLALAEDGSNKEGYYFVCVFSTPNRTIIWRPDLNKFLKLIETGAISGEIRDGVLLVVNEPNSKLVELIESEKYGLLFEWRDPYILRKK